MFPILHLYERNLNMNQQKQIPDNSINVNLNLKIYENLSFIATRDDKSLMNPSVILCIEVLFVL